VFLIQKAQPMKLGIISDTHNNLENLQAALTLLKAEGIGLLIHCGDATNMEVIQALGDFRVVYLFGNGDIPTGEMQETLHAMSPQNYAGLVYTDHIDGVSIAATHGHLEGQVDRWVSSGHFDYVFNGHSHRHRDVLVGNTHSINPGALGGLNVEARSFAVLDLQSRILKFIKI
jgi:putative phosphoesterase